MAGVRSAAKAADHTLYHLSPQGFWKKFRDAVVVNPNISSGVPIAILNRYPQPGSRPEVYSTPATKASDPANNPYWKRDVRRSYPRLSVVTQSQLATFLLQAPELPAASANETESAAVVETPAPQELTQAITTLTSAGKAKFTDVSQIPTPASPHPRWVPQRAEDAPHDPDSYFPMILVK